MGYNRLMIKINRAVTWGIVVMTGLAGLAGGCVYFVERAKAATSTLSMAATIEPSMTVTVSDATKTLNIEPSSSGTFGSTSVTVGAYSNGSVGYTLTMTPGSTTLNGSDTNTIPTLAGNSTCTGGSDCTSSNFTVGRWGIAVGNAVYKPATTSATNLVTVANTDAGVASNSYTINLGANLDLTTPVDTYSTTITFAATATIRTYDVTFNYDSNITALAVRDDAGEIVDPTTTGTNTATYQLFYANSYTFEPTYAENYIEDSITLASGSGILNTDILAYTVGAGDGTVALTSKIGRTYMQNVDKATLASLMPNVGDEYIVYDNRDDKPYTVAHMADGNYWMTQNLDLCIGCTGVAALTSENTNLTVSGSGAYSSGYATSGGVITWTPASTAITSNYTISGTTVSPAFTTSSYTTPYSAEGGDTYVYTSGSTGDDTVFTSLSDCMTTGGHTEAECLHYHVGNYYTWSAAIASNDSSSISTQYTNADNSICPKGWSLPKGRASSDTAATREFGQLFYSAGVTSSLTATSYATDGFNKLRTNPLFFVRGGYVYGSSLYDRASDGYYWSSTVYGSGYAYVAYFYSSYIYSANDNSRYVGFPVRCLVR